MESKVRKQILLGLAQNYTAALLAVRDTEAELGGIPEGELVIPFNAADDRPFCTRVLSIDARASLVVIGLANDPTLGLCFVTIDAWGGGWNSRRGPSVGLVDPRGRFKFDPALVRFSPASEIKPAGVLDALACILRGHESGNILRLKINS